MSTIAARMSAIASALAEHEDLPLGCVLVGRTSSSFGVQGWRFDAVREVLAWATRFGTEVIISLSSYGDGKVATNVELGGEPVSVDTTIGTAQAYELGRILQRELNRDVSIHISADDLLAAIDQAVTP